MKNVANTAMLAIALVTSTLAQAQTFDQSVAAAERGDNGTALTGFKNLAEKGHAKSQFNLGVIYRNGQGVPADDQLAMAWYRKAADQGDAAAQYNVGEMYRNGQGVDKEDQTAYYWLLLASTQGHLNAARNRDFLVRRLTPEQRAAVEVAVRNWKAKT